MVESFPNQWIDYSMARTIICPLLALLPSFYYCSCIAASAQGSRYKSSFPYREFLLLELR